MTTTSTVPEWLVSVDDHVIEPAGVWVDRLPRADHERAPHLITEADGSQFWEYEGRRSMTGGLGATAGRDPERFTTANYPYSAMLEGCYDPVARVADMDEAGILASLCFPSVPRFAGQLFLGGEDRSLALRCVQAYNDWMVDGWCAAAPGRFIPLIITPLWDPDLAAAEVRRCAGLGVHALTFSENPEALGLPSIHAPGGHWDPLWRAAEEAEVVICMHIGSSSSMPKVTSDAPHIVNWSVGASRASGTLMSWMFSGIFDRFPRLRIALSEGGVGWIPYYLERAQQIVDKQKHWMMRGEFHKTWDSAHAPSPVDLLHFDVAEVFHEHVYGCFIEDEVGMALIDRIGVDNVMIEVDYPHSDTSWPHSAELAQRQLAGLPVDVRHKVLRGNAERLFQFTPADPRVAVSP